MKQLFLIFGILFISACKEKAAEPEPTKSTLEYLTGTDSRNWKVTAGKVTVGTAELDLLNSQPVCVSDNILVLKKDFTYLLSEGNTKCVATDPDISIQSKWSVVESPKSITIDKFVFLGYVLDKPTFIIKSIDDKTFVGNTEGVISGNQFKATITFTAQP